MSFRHFFVNNIFTFVLVVVNIINRKKLTFKLVITRFKILEDWLLVQILGTLNREPNSQNFLRDFTKFFVI